MENKLRIIDEICLLHPSFGIEKEWSDYTGGMKDSGQWHVRKMLNESESDLQDFLNQMKEPEIKTTKNILQGNFESQYERLQNERERQLNFGKTQPL